MKEVFFIIDINKKKNLIMKFSRQKNKRISIQLFINPSERIQKNRKIQYTQISPVNLHNHKQQKQNWMFSPYKNQNRLRQQNKPHVQSLNISKKNIQITNLQQNQNQIQFSKNQKNKLKNQHKRTLSNRFYFHEITNKNKNDEMSNFSNSLENISKEVIQIPFAKKIILPIRKPQPQLIVYQTTTKPLEFKRNNNLSKRNSIQKFYTSPQTKIVKPQIKNITKNPLLLIPKSKKAEISSRQMPKLSDFALKPKKITQKGSIIYLALHKKLKMIFAIKSIRKDSIKNRLNAFIKQLKIGYLQFNPNIVRIFGFFVDQNNIYVIKQYIDQENVMSSYEKNNQSQISITVSQFLIGYMSLLNKSNTLWLVKNNNLVKSHGVCKITNYQAFELLKSQENQFILFFKKFIYFLLDNNNEEIITKQKGAQTSESILFMSGRKFSVDFNSFKTEIQNLNQLCKNSILKIWNHPFLVKYRINSIYE